MIVESTGARAARRPHHNICSFILVSGMSEFIAGPHPHCSEHARFEHAEKGIITPCIIYYYSMAVWKYGCSEIQVSGETGLAYTWLCSWMGSSCLNAPPSVTRGQPALGFCALRVRERAGAHRWRGNISFNARARSTRGRTCGSS